jgi:hypothetical protein
MEYLSLFDYLKRPAGSELGLKVAHEAQIHGVQTQTREISNPKYIGKVYLYPKDFLDFYFREPESSLDDFPTLGDIQDYDDLPF